MADIYILTGAAFSEAQKPFIETGLEIRVGSLDWFSFPATFGERSPTVSRVSYQYLRDSEDGITPAGRNWEREQKLAIARACTARSLPLPSTMIHFEEWQLQRELHALGSRYIPAIQALSPYAVYDKRLRSDFSFDLLWKIRGYKSRISPQMQRILRPIGAALDMTAGLAILPFATNPADLVHDMING